MSHATSMSVIIPARNDAHRLSRSVRAVLSYFAQHQGGLELIVVDAGSTDGTRSVADGLLMDVPGSRILSVSARPGHNNKGLAVRTGMLAANGDVHCFIDADNAAPFEQVDSFLPLLGENDVVIGSRYIPGGDPGPRSPLRHWVSRGGNLVFRSALGLHERDTHCPLKVFTAQASRTLFGLSRVDGLGFDAEVLVLAHRLGMHVAEVPVTWRHVEQGTFHPAVVLESLSEVCRIRRNLREHLYDPDL